MAFDLTQMNAVIGGFVRRPVLAAFGIVLIAGCSTPGPGGAPGGIHDPYEETNRRNHAINRGLDKALLRPAGKSYTKVLPDPIEDSISYFAANLALPSTVVNNVLQGDLKGAGQNTLRFVVNSTVGFAGLADPATEFGIPAKETDFGATLHKWGVPEGAYVEIPGIGPSTERAAVGKVVDLFTNPLGYVLPKPERYLGTGAGVMSKLGSRGRYSDTVDSILYDSADSYAQSRLIYLQNRRFELGGKDGGAYVDPYDDQNGGGQNAADPYADPYDE